MPLEARDDECPGELKLQVVVSCQTWVLGIKPGSLRKAVMCS